MIYADVIDNEKCTGCMKCKEICPNQAISVRRNEQGFDYPQIDTSKCSNCNRCRTECTSNKTIEGSFECKKIFAVQACADIRKISSSGGFFSVAAEYILKKGGIVCGAAFVNNVVKHILVYSIDQLDLLRRSKYVQSDISDVYEPILQYLTLGKEVLFVGTSCQCDAVKEFCKAHAKQLYTIDILCMGVPSPGLFERYLKEEFIGRVDNINFRDKSRNGWTQDLEMSITEDDVKKYLKINESSFFKMFLDGYALRTNCYDCHYAGKKRVTDISIGDFWGIGTIYKELDDGLGTSLVIVSTEKGMNLFDSVRSDLAVCQEVPEDVALKSNPILLYPSEDRGRSKLFSEYIKNNTLSSAVDKMDNYRVDCGIINFWWADDNGGILTAYALQRTLSKLGYTSELVDLKSDCVTGGISEKFARNHLRITKRVMTKADYKELNNLFETFIVGSDQVFRAEWVPDEWFLDFVKAKKKKIAVSASFGKDSVDLAGNRLMKVKYLLSRFDAISVREKQAVKICEDLGVSSNNIIDPVFYLSREEYLDELGIDKDCKNAYVFVYYRDITEEKMDFCSKIASQHKCSVFYADDSTEVETFLEKLANSILIITDSYHAVCFSLIFNKPYLCILNKLRGIERFNSLIEIFELGSSQFIEEDELYCHNIGEMEFDWKKINDLIKVRADESKQWLATALERKKKVFRLLPTVRKLQYLRYFHRAEISSYIENRRAFFSMLLNPTSIYEKTVCFGAGAYGKRYVEKNNKNVCFFMDNSKKRRWVGSIPVFSLSEGKRIIGREHKIVVTTSSAYQDEIVEQLNENGFYNIEKYS